MAPSKLNFFQPIPEGKPMDGWKNNVIDDKNPRFLEPLVPVGPFSRFPEIASDGVYFGERETSPYAPGELKGSLLASFVRQNVAERLKEASKLLPPRCVLMTLDTLRTEDVQRSLFENFKNKLTQPPHNVSEEVAIEKTQQYVSLPSRPNSPHLTGGAVDLTIVEFKDDASWNEYRTLTEKLKNITSAKEIENIELQRSALLRECGKMLDMGVAFDQVALDAKGRDKTALRYFEMALAEDGVLSEKDTVALNNRRLLYNVLTAVGFTFYPDEPWHADYGNKFWAQQSGQKAIYGYAEPSAENMEHEYMRRALLAKDVFIYNYYQVSNFPQEVKDAVTRLENPRYSSQPQLKGHKISPAATPA